MEIDTYEPGVPSWIDLGSPDPQGAADFYGALFGWDAPEGPPETGGYRVAMVGDRAVAGIGQAQNPGPPVWATYIAVESADATAEKVTAAGGQVILPPMDVLDVGRMAVFTDSVGAFFSVWQAGTHPGAQLVNEPGTWSWSELAHHRPRRVEGVLRRGVRMGCQHAGRRSDGLVHRVAGQRSVGRRDDAEAADAARRGAAVLGASTSRSPTPTPPRPGSSSSAAR